MKNLTFLCFVLFAGFNSIAQELLTISLNNFESTNDSLPWMNVGFKKSGQAHSGSYYSYVDTTVEYGVGYKNTFPENCRHKNLRISVSAYLRITSSDNPFSLVISIAHHDSTIVWNSINVLKTDTDSLGWFLFTDTIEVPASLTTPEYYFTAFFWNPSSRAIFDVDDLRFDFMEKQMPHFIPPYQMEAISSNDLKVLAATPYYVISIYEQNGQVAIKRQSGEPIFSGLHLYTEWNKVEGGNLLNESSGFTFKKDSLTSDGVYVIFTGKQKVLEMNLAIFLGNNGKIGFTSNTYFMQAALIHRHALVISLEMPLGKVYRKNAKIDTAYFRDEYWLDREGFTIGKQNFSLTLYHPEILSSIQLDTKNSRAFMNIDYACDHPMLHYPLLQKQLTQHMDRSPSVFSKGDQAQSKFNFYASTGNVNLPILLKTPNGFLSSFVWTEHADFSDLRMHRAVYFGSDKITGFDNATGGFVKHSIPVTKSFFYANPDLVDNAVRMERFAGPIACYKDNPEFSNFLKQLYENGFELCLHTPDHYTTSRKLLEEALEVTRREFMPETWIDHGYDNLASSNREDLNCDGLDVKSKYYSADLWKQYGLKYFWNSYFEDTGIYAPYSFNSFFLVPYSGWGDAMPTPFAYRHKTRSGDFIHWTTTSTLDPPDGSLWSYLFDDIRLDDMVQNRSNVVIHCYAPRVDSTNGFYVINEESIRINPDFDHALAALSRYRNEGKIWLTTIRDLVRFRTSLENLTYELNQDGTIRLHNAGKSVLRGITFSALANDVTAENKEIIKKKVGDELIFWMDIKPGESVSLAIK